MRCESLVRRRRGLLKCLAHEDTIDSSGRQAPDCGKDAHLVVRLQPSHPYNSRVWSWFVGRGKVHNHAIKEVILKQPTYALILGSSLTKLIVTRPEKLEKVETLAGSRAKSSVHLVDWKEVRGCSSLPQRLKQPPTATVQPQRSLESRQRTCNVSAKHSRQSILYGH